MKLAFIYNNPDPYWNDGLKAAIDLLAMKWDIRRQNAVYQPYMCDLALVWGALGSSQVTTVADWPMPKAICIAGGPINHPDIHKFDIVFVETRWHQREFRKIGIDAKLAFGTNTDLFRRIPQTKVFDAIFPATFAAWKRHYLFAERYKDKGLAVGWMQPNGWEKECYETCQEKGSVVLPAVPAETLAYLYNASKTVYLPADIWGGCERAVLEGLACGCNVEVEADNPKLVELLADQTIRLSTHYDYADTLKRTITDFLKEEPIYVG